MQMWRTIAQARGYLVRTDRGLRSRRQARHAAARVIQAKVRSESYRCSRLTHGFAPTQGRVTGRVIRHHAPRQLVSSGGERASSPAQPSLVETPADHASEARLALQRRAKARRARKVKQPLASADTVAAATAAAEVATGIPRASQPGQQQEAQAAAAVERRSSSSRRVQRMKARARARREVAVRRHPAAIVNLAQMPGADRDAQAPKQGQSEAALDLATAEEEEQGVSSGGEGEWSEQGGGGEDAEELFGDEEDWSDDEEDWSDDEEEWTGDEEELSGDEEDWSDAGQDWSGADDEEVSGDESGLTSEDEEAFMLDAEREWAAKEIQRHVRGRMLRQLMRQAQAEVEASLAADPVEYEAWPPVAAADWRYPVVQLHQRGILLASQGASTEACDVLEEALELLIKSVPAGMATDAGLEAELQDQVPRPPPTA
eukprot:SAG25_NODE_2321_length_1725_cov_1.350554_1_plen_431_part_00